MKSIKGLIVKDLLNLNHYKFSLFVMVMIFVGIGVADTKTLNFLPIMLMTMIGMIGLSTFSYDEISKADKYLLTLPTTKKAIVKAKYILIIAMILLGAIISIAATVGINYVVNKEIMNLEVICATLVGGFLGISLVECIQIPSVYKWGAEKGRIQMFILIILVAGLIGGAIYLLTTFGIGVDFNNITEFIKNFGIYVAIIFIGIMYFISYRLSCKIFQKKEL